MKIRWKLSKSASKIHLFLMTYGNSDPSRIQTFGYGATSIQTYGWGQFNMFPCISGLFLCWRKWAKFIANFLAGAMGLGLDCVALSKLPVHVAVVLETSSSLIALNSSL